MDFLSWLKGIFGRRGGDDQKLLTEPSDKAEDPRLSKTKEELCAKLDEAEAVIEKLKRAYAEEINNKAAFQKRLQKEQTRKIDEARAKVLRELLDLSDEMDRALSALKDDSGPLAKGVRMIHNSMKSRLEKSGVERMKLVGTFFDPNTAEAMSTAPADAQEKDGIILEELRPGFTLNGIVIREARVSVAKWTPPPEPEHAEEDKSPQNTTQEAEDRPAGSASEGESTADAPKETETEDKTAENMETSPEEASESGAGVSAESKSNIPKNSESSSGPAEGAAVSSEDSLQSQKAVADEENGEKPKDPSCKTDAPAEAHDSEENPENVSGKAADDGSKGEGTSETSPDAKSDQGENPHAVP